ncbi:MULTISPECIES: hypothetical protein [unclassified Methylobacterium]|uniref:hypothetical protein n=1 Tax=unclassified Methylobacterium TaxID=2615210 RepID=UPI0011C20E51|nr:MULTISPECIES: hypothetical protein [unclassified Methylobacterium]QEE38835.1 hypothetical protein FVA80_07520 [Methylobacterium sp. WL1]TXN53823.1 hypothetical protein FV241_26680 [Methylobacterium sp. WL2]
MDIQTLDETDRAIVRGLLFRRWPFDVPAKEMAADRLVDIAARTRRLEPHVERFRGRLDAARQGMREDLLSLAVDPLTAA